MWETDVVSDNPYACRSGTFQRLYVSWIRASPSGAPPDVIIRREARSEPLMERFFARWSTIGGAA